MQIVFPWIAVPVRMAARANRPRQGPTPVDARLSNRWTWVFAVLASAAALLAPGVRLVLHDHPGTAHAGAPVHCSGERAPDLSAAGSALPTPSDGRTGPRHPSLPPHPGPDDCPICDAILALAQQILPPAPPALPEFAEAPERCALTDCARPRGGGLIVRRARAPPRDA